MKYRVPDPLWESFGANNFEEYCEKFVVSGKFHPAVPQEIVNEYVQVEYLLSSAYYSYPLLDEAISKALKIMELAVKIKCKQSGILLSQKASSKSRKSLKELIDALDKMEPLKDLQELNHLREL